MQVSKELLNNGVERHVRGLNTKEIDEEVCIILQNPVNSLVTISPRHLDERVYKYLEGEFNWFKSGSLDLAPIQPYATFWNAIANHDKTVNSNYGFYTFKQKTPEEGMSQFDWCVTKLKADNYSRQAVININQPMHKFLSNKDFCCTIAQNFIFRKGKLDCIVWMRSNDFIFGSTYNFPWFNYIHKQMADAVGLPLGKYVHMVSSLHVYDNHFKMLEKMANFSPTESDNQKAKEITQMWSDFSSGKIPTFWEAAWNRMKE